MEFYGSFLSVFLTGLVLGLIFTPVAIWLAPKIGAVDVPKDSRRMHTKPMPRFGGMAIFIGTTGALLITMLFAFPMLQKYLMVRGMYQWFAQPEDKIWALIVGGALIYALGVIDDLKNLPAKVKFLGQIVCASVVWFMGIRISFISLWFSIDHLFFSEAISYVLTVLWIVGISNTVNLTDGLDGLAAGVSTIASICLAYTSYIHGSYLAALAFLAIAGGALGFLRYNFHPAKIFMGDGGSLFLGFMLATTSIIGVAKSATVIAMIAPVLVLFVPIFDTSFAILRRVANHRPIMEADKGHLHHRLMAAGLGQRRSVMMLYGVAAVMGIASVLFSRDLYVETAGLLLVACMYIYIFLTDASSGRLSLKGVNVKEIERREEREKDREKDHKGEEQK
ncbi:MAG: undecaprenyl/decaprenyl-phosphate alpha-N-acetylglucosaminyl 1-phosphate transferase [Firmicutes bacterium]|nr:undecaprenyl/decaprenyl-phosphate alpha-N-acetylglucosaminyl 1-phosphate transferase [Bacillota bacterium]